MWSFAAALVVVLAAEPVVTPTPAVTPAEAPVVRFGDPPLSAALQGATVVVKKANGAFYQGLVTECDATRIVIDSIHQIPAAEVAGLFTVRPA